MYQRSQQKQFSIQDSVSLSLIDRRGFLPEDQSVQTAAAGIEVPAAAAATKSEMNVVGGSSGTTVGLTESVVPVCP